MIDNIKKATVEVSITNIQNNRILINSVTTSLTRNNVRKLNYRLSVGKYNIPAN